MRKVFLSHSSKDKNHYVEIVARQLVKEIGEHRVIYDNLTFEEGIKSIDEIMSGLDSTDIFVIFLSNNSLQSDWVKIELNRAFELEKTGHIKRIFPMVIEENLKYDDVRVPDWLSSDYNLKPVKRPSVATRRIIQKLRELIWSFNPRIESRERFFVGRNELMSVIETRLDSIDLMVPTCLIASGIPTIGRKSFLENCLKKTNVVKHSHKLPVILLDSHQSIEDFIKKIYDLGFTSEYSMENLISMTIEEKIDLATKLVEEIQEAKEIILIRDRGCIVTPDREINEWFLSLIQRLQPLGRICFCVTASFRLHNPTINRMGTVYVIDMPELSPSERGGLLKRYSLLEELELERSDLNNFTDILNGYPEQVFFTVDLIKERGLLYTRNHTELIVDYTTEKVQILLGEYADDEKALDLLYLLSRFEFVSYEVLFDILNENEDYFHLLEKFISKAICGTSGANNEYIRVNDAIRDYVTRLKPTLPEEFRRGLQNHLNNFLETYESEEKDISDLLFSIKEALMQKQPIDERFLIPSNYLKTMKELYDRGERYDEVINLADIVLRKSSFMDQRIKFEIQYYLCSSLARTRNPRFLDEVQKIKGHEHNFLMGFYYRINGNTIGALDRLKTALEQKPNFSRAKRELVIVYLNIEDFDTAYELAKQNYENDTNNPYHIQAFFQCLSNTNETELLPYEEKVQKLQELLGNLKKIKSEKADVMYMEMQAEFMAVFEGDPESAIPVLDRAIDKYHDNLYPLFSKFRITQRLDLREEMRSTIEEIEKRVTKRSKFHNLFLKNKAIYLATIGDAVQAFSMVAQLRNYPENAKNRVLQKLEKLLQQ